MDVGQLSSADFILSATEKYSTPFELHDDAYVLKAMRSRENEQNDTPHESTSNGGESSRIPSLYQHHHIPHSSRSNTIGKWPNSPRVPGILKATRVKHEQ